MLMERSSKVLKDGVQLVLAAGSSALEQSSRTRSSKRLFMKQYRNLTLVEWRDMYDTVHTVLALA
jgi:hypothetical protein